MGSTIRSGDVRVETDFEVRRLVLGGLKEAVVVARDVDSDAFDNCGEKFPVTFIVPGRFVLDGHFFTDVKIDPCSGRREVTFLSTGPYDWHV